MTTIPQDTPPELADDRRAYRDLWLAEMWRPVRELSREDRAVERALRRAS